LLVFFWNAWRLNPPQLKTGGAAFVQGTEGHVPRSGLIEASDGALYGTTEQGGGQACGQLRELFVRAILDGDVAQEKLALFCRTL
jgi:hypothetical protein